MSRYRNRFSGDEQATIWYEALKEVREACDDQREIIDEIAMRAKAKIEEGKPVKCRACFDTGYTDVRGENRCLYGCPMR